jgi:hypothetical protein
VRAILVDGDISTYPSKVPGLAYEVQRISASRYFRVAHPATGDYVINLNNAPISGKIADYVALADLIFSAFDWTIAVEKMDLTAGYALVCQFRARLERENKYGGNWRIKASGPASTLPFPKP